MKRWPHLVLCSVLASAAEAQTNIEQIIRSENIAGAYASIINFATEPDISAAKLKIDADLPEEDELRIVKFPLRKEFTLDNRQWKPVIQGTLSRLELRSSLPAFAGETIDGTWTSYSATLGGGVRIPLSKHWNILPAVDGGYAYLKSEAEYGPVGEAVLKPILSGKLYDWEAHAWTLSAHLALLYNQTFRKLEIDAHLSGTVSHIQSFHTTSDLQEFEERIGTITIKADATHPLGFSILNCPIFGVAHLGHSSLVSDSEVNLGFRFLNEAGFSLKTDISHYGTPIKSLSLGAMVLWGDHVGGWKILTTYRF
ncbi:Solitary outer membrane autotransporter beta-barrel domain [Pontiellaceae bacterium B12227]|nr:Solitary outer membrane autotransporter beta-barrel domain [Pontiellaceae bacterium B12227]